MDILLGLIIFFIFIVAGFKASVLLFKIIFSILSTVVGIIVIFALIPLGIGLLLIPAIVIGIIVLILKCLGLIFRW
ncbi:MAG TPA: hypothetical protein GX396_01225 [Tissierellia bacterium]|nr:hypothetical protein [Tissierellia bacterium]